MVPPVWTVTSHGTTSVDSHISWHHQYGYAFSHICFYYHQSYSVAPLVWSFSHMSEDTTNADNQSLPVAPLVSTVVTKWIRQVTLIYRSEWALVPYAKISLNSLKYVSLPSLRCRIRIFENDFFHLNVQRNHPFPAFRCKGSFKVGA